MKIKKIILKTKVGEKRVFSQGDYYYAEIGRVIDIVPDTLDVDGDLVDVYYANSSEPHAVILKQDANKEFAELENFFLKINKNKKLFPRGMNFNVVDKIGDDIISVETFERGCLRKTNSCGTGSVASVAVLQEKDIISRGRIKIIVPGGEFFVECKDGIFFLVTK